MSTSLPHGLDEHGQSDGPDILAGELQRVVAYPGTGLDPLRDFRRSAHCQFNGCNPAPVTGTGSKVPSGEACKSKGLAAWCVLPLRWFWASLLGPDAAASGAFPNPAGCRGSSILLTRHSIQRLFSSRSSALQISKISRARIPSSRIWFATTGGTYMTRSPSSEYMTCSPYRPSTRFPSSQRRATSTGEFVLNRRIPFVIVVLLVLLPGVPVLSLLLQVHRPPRVAVLLPVPLLARRRRVRTGGMSRSEGAFHTGLFYADATLDTMVVARPENRERVFEDAVRRFVNRRGFLRRRTGSTRQSSASPVAPQRAHWYSSWVSSSSLTR